MCGLTSRNDLNGVVGRTLLELGIRAYEKRHNCTIYALMIDCDRLVQRVCGNPFFGAAACRARLPSRHAHPHPWRRGAGVTLGGLVNVLALLSE